MTDREIISHILSPDPLGDDRLEECFRFLSEGVAKKPLEPWGSLAFAFRSKIVKEKAVRSYADIAALDLLCVQAALKEGKPWQGRPPALEALEAIKKGDSVISRPDKLGLYAELGEDFLALDDVKRAKDAFNDASLLATQLAQRDKAIDFMKRNLDLAWRYDEADRLIEMPTRESLLMQFGREDAKSLLDYAKVPHGDRHDPIETNPMYLKVIDAVNETLFTIYEKERKKFSENDFNHRKKEVLASFGLSWNPPQHC